MILLQIKKRGGKPVDCSVLTHSIVDLHSAYEFIMSYYMETVNILPAVI